MLKFIIQWTQPAVVGIQYRCLCTEMALTVAYYTSWHGLHVQLDALSLPLPAHALLVMVCRLVVRTCLCLLHPQEAISDERSEFQILVLEVLQKVTHFSGGHLVW